MHKEYNIVEFVSDFHHNGHSIQRDRMLVDLHGWDWLVEQKALGNYGADWPPEVIGTPKEKSPIQRSDSKIPKVEINSFEELAAYFKRTPVFRMVPDPGDPGYKE